MYERRVLLDSSERLATERISGDEVDSIFFFFMLKGLSLCSIEHHHYMVLKILSLNYF